MKSIYLFVIALFLNNIVYGQDAITDDEIVNITEQATIGWELYQKEIYSSKNHTDSTPKTKGFDFWSDGEIAKFDRDSNGLHETIFEIKNNILFYIGTLGRKGTFIHVSGSHHNLMGKSAKDITRESRRKDESYVTTLFQEGRSEEAMFLSELLETNGLFTENGYFNAGLSAYLAGNYKPSLYFWNKVKESAPDDPMLHVQFIRTYGALNDIRNRDREISELYTLCKREKDCPKLDGLFIREDFKVAGLHVAALEYFRLETEGERAKKWSFRVKDINGEFDYRITLGSYNSTNSYMSADKPLPNGKRYYHLDGYYKNDHEHKTYLFFTGQPKYDDVKTYVSDIITGKLAAVSGSDNSAGTIYFRSPDLQ